MPSHICFESIKEFGIAFDSAYPVIDDEKPPRDFIRRQTWETEKGPNGRETQGEPLFTGIDSGEKPFLSFLQAPAEQDPISGEQQLVDPDVLDRPGPVPAAVYHSLAQWDRSFLIVIDIDAKDLAYERAIEAVGSQDSKEDTLERAGILSAPPEGYPYSFADIEQALSDGFEIKEILEQDFGATDTLVVYSGQGCHVYLRDDDREHRYDTDSRDALAKLLTEIYEFTIDKQVTIDSSRLIRLPYSLHSDVCRVVQPIESPSFDFRGQALPESLIQRHA